MASTRIPTGRTRPADQRLTATECRSWLVNHHQGRLDYLTGRGPRSLVVRYTVDADRILVRVPTFNELLQYAPGESVTLEVDDRVSIGGYETVKVTGTARVVDTDRATLAEDWPAELPTRLISLPIQQIDGFVQTPDLPAAAGL